MQQNKEISPTGKSYWLEITGHNELLRLFGNDGDISEAQVFRKLRRMEIMAMQSNQDTKPCAKLQTRAARHTSHGERLKTLICRKCG